MPAVPRLLPAAIVLAVSATLLGGGVAAADLRADERRAEAERQRIAAAEALTRAEADYRITVGALAEEIFDQVQPLQETADRVAEADDGSFTVLSDVSSEGGGVDALKSLRTRLDAVVPPPTLADGHRTLDAGMEQLSRGGDALLFSVDPDLGDDSFFREFVRGDEALDKGVRILNAELEKLFSAGGLPSLAAETGAGRAARPATGKAAYLYAVGALCAPTPADNADDAAGLRRDAAGLRDLLRGLAAVSAPAPDADLVRTSIGEHLEGGTALAEGLEGIAVALDKRDQRAFVAAQVKLERGSLELDQAAEGFGAYGSETCKLAFASDDEEGEQEPERPA